MPQISKPVVDERTCRRFRVFPLNGPSGDTHLLFDQSADISFLSYFVHFWNCAPLPVRVTAEELDVKINSLVDTLLTPDSSSHVASMQETALDGTVVNEINEIIRECISSGASDIHFEPGEKELLCRARIDGVLSKKRTIVKDRLPETISRLKIMANLDIAEKRRPQDGRIRFSFESRTVDIRVSIIPTDFGEKAVLRLLDKDKLRLDLQGLGFLPEQLQTFKEGITQPNGIILVTGPTGSGKTTTLYAALSTLRSPNVNISTVEDPIEYYVDGVNQTQVKPDIDLTFSKMLRALLRQDPNIIMVGEIRDRETLDIAIRASLTGHLVLSTVHTNSAVATITRLLDMGAEPYLISSSLRLVVAQRLLRLNCSNCLTAEMDEGNYAAATSLGLLTTQSSRRGTGCQKCNYTGFSGRIAVYELLKIDDDLKQAITSGKSEADLTGIAHRSGFQSMLQSAQSLIDSGKTTPLEVLREISQ
jgi:type II secretory ATPase GspE/PulE/Tfp pilus assembly ATPase PilB-like protein